MRIFGYTLFKRQCATKGDLEDLNANIELCIKLLRRIKPASGQRAVLSVGPLKGIELMAYSLSPGQTKTLTVQFTDNATPPVQHALSAPPTAVDSTGVAVIAPVGTLDASGLSAWTVTAPASAVVGSSLSVVVTGTNPDGTADAQTYPISISALDDTQQVATFA